MAIHCINAYCFTVEIGVAGSMAGSVMAFLNCPIELLKVKLQTQDPKGFVNASGKHEPAVSRCFFFFCFFLLHLAWLIYNKYSIKV